MARLSREELAVEAGITPGRVDDLVRVGVVKPGPDGDFATPDVARDQSSTPTMRQGSAST